MARADSNGSLLLPEHIKLKKESERTLTRYQLLDTNDDTVLLLRTFLQYLPTEGQSNLAKDITSCQTDTSLRQLASSLETGLLRPLLAEASQTPRSSSPRFSLFPEDEELLEDLRSILYEPVRELKGKCMERDRGRCVVTGFYDVTSDDVPPDAKRVSLDLAHILPFSLGGQGRFSRDEDRLRMSTVWKKLYRYFPRLRSTLRFDVNDINSTENAMILMKPLHEKFGMFHLSLEPTEMPNQYRLKKSRGFQDYLETLFPRDAIVTFTAHARRYPIPNPILLETHAAIADILDVTGIRTRIVRDRYDLKNKFRFLARDGSTDIGRILSVSRLSILASNKDDAHRERSLLKNGG